MCIRDRYEVTDEVKKAIADEFYAGCCDDEQTKACIKEILSLIHIFQKKQKKLIKI